MRIPTFENFLQENTTRKISQRLNQILHEGVRMVPVIPLNEGSVDHAQYELDRLLKKAGAKGETPVIQEFVPEIMALESLP